ncbi:putative CAB/ELIP/HLIP family protein [Stanieria cyanosphaera PCC 7437]|uniref:CAB/ELIP/HLIP family protein n=1 Tax=Stanieria cyanosphaera (strain ATCC 29371 / PCC 7437) TaxID=111780 RepID=K9XTF2_STAC7|nr:chlorophyll a/b-binding protein [Stanieria cyanosphaera]AFZ35880.1 putative CAB/ELIP/HLIP family protein [Stanieria cyanosphaera PCC 7437]
MQNRKPKLGFTRFAEIWNGRLAMLGFVSVVLIELITGRGILTQLGLI